MSELSKNTKALLRRIRRFAKDFAATGMTTHASSTAFFFFSSLIPLAVIVAYIVSASGMTEQNLVSVIDDVVPAALMDFVKSMIHEAYDRSGLALTVSIVMMLWTSSKGISALTRGLDAVYDAQEQRSWLVRTAVSLASVVAIVLLLVAAMYLIFGGGVIRALHNILPQFDEPDAVTMLVRSGGLFIAAVAVFSACYTILPAGKRRFVDQLPGAALAAIAWSVFSIVFRVYIDNSASFTLLYGSLATIVLFLLWLYCIFLIFLAGGFFNRCWKSISGD